MSKIWKNKKRVACLLAAMALLLTGVMTTMLQTSKDKEIDTSAAGLYPEGWDYVLDYNMMQIGTGKGSMMASSNAPHFGWDGESIFLMHNLYTPETKAANIPPTMTYNDGSSYPPIRIETRIIGPYVDTKGTAHNVYEGYFSDTIDIEFPDAALKNDGSRHKVYMTISSISMAVRNSAKACERPKIFSKGWFNAYNYKTGEYAESWSTNVGVRYQVTIRVDGAQSGESVFNVFRDLDRPTIVRNSTSDNWNYGFNIGGINRFGIDLYQEGIAPTNNTYGINTNPGANINVWSWQSGFSQACGNQNNENNDSLENAISFLAEATGYQFVWAGQNCGTQLGIDPNDSHLEKTRADVYVTYEQKTGSWSNWNGTDTWDLLKTEEKFKGWKFGYTYPNDFSNHAVYDNPSTVNVDGVSNIDLANRGFTYSMGASHAFSYYIPRRWYMYRFDFDLFCPTGHSASEIKNKQTDFEKRAENTSDPVKTPSLTGYTFLGFFDSNGVEYKQESMLSNKTFYAKWRKNKYYVRYAPNGSTNFNHQNWEYVQNKTNGTMEKSTYEYDTEGKLRKNTFTREGYVFTGWNTKADGSGTARSDENRVYNWATEDGETITLYAQWRKKLGNETITVVSEETGNPVSNVTMKLQKQVQGNWVDMGSSFTTSSAGQIKVSNLHWFNYRWVMTSVPAGYYKNTETPESCYTNYPSTDFVIRPCGTCGKEVCDQFTVTNRVILYMKHVNITLSSVVDCIIKGEDAPAFMYHINGLDAAGVRHEYNVLVQTNESIKAGGTQLVHDIFAGTYTVTQVPVSRYVPGTAINLANSTINGTNATVDVLNHELASVRFPYTLTNHGWYYGVDSENNRLRK